MLLEPVIGILIIRDLRKSLKRDGLLSKWNRASQIASAVYLLVFMLSTTVKDHWHIVTWIGHATLLALIYFVFTRKEFKSTRPFIYAFLPVIVVFLIEDIATTIDPTLKKRWGDYFGVAGVFGFIWMGAMLFINNRQRKALEKERLKVEEKEKEFRVAEELKAALEIQVRERTSELTLQKEELQMALEELKSTQSQLIHSEKMASLGELTAGIAHEIQNPLNFVNNFSELNAELIDELEDAINTNDLDQISSLAKDIKENELKISHHGKRADAIVKGMLQHSRTSTGQKEPTDINELCDEYLRLAFHGLRAKDKTFNAKFETNFDPSVEKLNVISQDIGRVILNLINNSFYAVSEKQKTQETATRANYVPTVIVGTKKLDGRLEISVKDNGMGIPQKVLNKIFQPFFTTKPTGQGTGLGLSLSHDIVKAHGGELKVKTREGEGTEFIIQLPTDKTV